jgi:hypothetical protein
VRTAENGDAALKVLAELLLDRLTNYARMIEIIEPVLAVPGVRRY